MIIRLGHQLNSTYSLSKIMWVRDHEPDAWARVRHFGLAKDFIVHRLTGRLHTDPSDASSTNAFDIKAGTWSEPIIEASGLPRSIFPEVPSGTWRSWIHRDAQRGEAQRRWREYIEPDEHGRVRIGPAPEPERMPVRAWDVRGDALYRLGDLTEHVEERRGDARRGPKAKERRAG